MTSNSKNVVPAVQLVPSDLRGLQRFVSSGGDDDLGDRLRVNGEDGSIYVGSQGATMEPGTKLAVFLGQIMEGFVYWKDGQLADQRWVNANDPAVDLTELRAQMGQANPNEWQETLPSGLPKDPISPAVKFPVCDVATGNLFTYSVNSFNGVKAARRMVKACIVQRGAAMETTADCLPVVEITVASKMTPHGKIYWGQFEVVDWSPIAHVMHTLGKRGNAGAFGVSNAEALNEDLGDEPEAEPAKPAAKPKSKSLRY
jgi:hypothetical protein